MRRVLPVLAVLLAFTCTFTSMDVEAKKFGGSKSFGKSFKVAPSQPKNITAPAFGNSASKSTTQNNLGQTKKRGFFGGFGGGMLGGLLAGGLIASLFGGGGLPFQGMQFMDILILAAVAFIAFKIFRSMSRAKTSSLNGGRAASETGNRFNTENSDWLQKANTQQNSRDAGFDTIHQEQQAPFQQQSAGTASGSSSGFGATNSDVPFNLPPDFDLNGFLAGSRNHYKLLQEAWNSGNMSTIREYVAPDLYAHLERERAALKGDQHTEVMYVDTELVRSEMAFGKAEISLRFSGRYRDNVERVEEKITDIWHLERDLNQANAPWLIVGIEYAED